MTTLLWLYILIGLGLAIATLLTHLRQAGEHPVIWTFNFIGLVLLWGPSLALAAKRAWDRPFIYQEPAE